MKPACPKCFEVVTYEEYGGLFSVHCPACGWHEEGTVNRPLHPPSEPGPVLVAKAMLPVSALALKAIRTACTSASLLSLETLVCQLASEHGFWLGQLPKYRADELRAEFSAVGISVEEAPHEES